MPAPKTPTPLVIVGAGGFGRECLSIVRALKAQGAALLDVGFVDDDPRDGELLERLGARCLGAVGTARDHASAFVIAIGTGATRSAVAERLSADGLIPHVLIHPDATVGEDCRLGPGTIVNCGARATTNVATGCHVQLHANCAVGHDAQLGDFVSVYPGATISGSVVLENAVTIGTGANVLPGRRVGTGAFVGAGAVVHRDVAAGSVVVGVPAHAIG